MDYHSDSPDSPGSPHPDPDILFKAHIPSHACLGRRLLENFARYRVPLGSFQLRPVKDLDPAGRDCQTLCTWVGPVVLGEGHGSCVNSGTNFFKWTVVNIDRLIQDLILGLEG